MKKLVRRLDDSHLLYRDDTNGLAWVEETTSGMCYSAHPNIDRTGSVRGMKKQGMWGTKDMTVRSHGYIYNISHLVITDHWDKVAADECHCACCSKRELS